jgi:hypothetical protein
MPPNRRSRQRGKEGYALMVLPASPFSVMYVRARIEMTSSSTTLTQGIISAATHNAALTTGTAMWPMYAQEMLTAATLVALYQLAKHDVVARYLPG